MLSYKSQASLRPLQYQPRPPTKCPNVVKMIKDFYRCAVNMIKLLEKEKQNIKNLVVKKGFLRFYSVFVYMCVCVFVCLLPLYRCHRLTQEAETLTQIPICEYLKMVSFTLFEFLHIFGIIPLFNFLLMSLFQGQLS